MGRKGIYPLARMISTRINQGLYDVPGIGVATCAVAVTEPRTPPQFAATRRTRGFPFRSSATPALEEIEFPLLQNSIGIL